MSFLFTSFLVALAAIAIPVILHLFHFRRYKKVLFPSVVFLKDIVRSVQSHSKLKRLLVLFCRIMAVSFIVFAFAQPFIPSGKENRSSNGTGFNAVYLDNSFSMEASSDGDKLIHKAVKRIEHLALSVRPSDKVFLTNNQFNPRQFRPLTRDELVESINDLHSVPVTRAFSEVLVRQQEVLTRAGDGERIIYIFSDFQKSFFDIEKANPDSETTVHLVHLESGSDANMYIDSCWFYSPVHQLNKPEKMFIRIKNTSGEALENVPLKLYINSRQKSLSNISVPARGNITAEVSFTVTEPGVQHGVIIVDDYPIEFDNTFYLSYSVLDTIRILAVSEDSGSGYLDNLYNKNEFTSLDNVLLHSLNYSSFNSYHLIVFHDLKAMPTGLAGTMNDFVRQGGSVLMFLPIDCDGSTYQQMSDDGLIPAINPADTGHSRIGFIDFEHELFTGVFDDIPDNPDVPVVRYHYPVTPGARSSASVIMKLDNGDPALIRIPYGKGQIWLFTVPLHNRAGNFHRHALFVPVMLKIALLSQPVGRLFYTIGKDEIISLSYGLLSPDDPVHITRYSRPNEAQNHAVDIIPEFSTSLSGSFINVHDQIDRAGNYHVLSGQEIIQGIAFNYDRSESDPDCYSAAEISEMLQKPEYRNYSLEEDPETLSAYADAGSGYGKPLWKICVLLALLFIGAEGLLLRFLK